MGGYIKKNILGVKVVDIKLSELSREIISNIEKGGKKTFFCGNPQALNLYQKDNEFKHAIDDAFIIYPEGIGVVIASKALGRPLSERTNLLDFLFDVLRHAESNKWPIYILGGRQIIPKKASENLRKKFPKLLINYHHGYFEKKEEAKVIQAINKTKSKILLVAMGIPMQEIWINKHKSEINATGFFGIGGAIDILAGRIPRAPKWLRKIGLEWLYRTYKEPARLSGRYFIGNTVFVFRVFRQVLYNATNAKR